MPHHLDTKLISAAAIINSAAEKTVGIHVGYLGTWVFGYLRAGAPPSWLKPPRLLHSLMPRQSGVRLCLQFFAQQYEKMVSRFVSRGRAWFGSVNHRMQTFGRFWRW